MPCKGKSDIVHGRIPCYIYIYIFFLDITDGLQTIHYRVSNAYYIRCMIYYILYTVYYILYATYYMLYAIHYILSTIHYLLSTIYSILYTIYYVLCTLSHRPLPTESRNVRQMSVTNKLFLNISSNLYSFCMSVFRSLSLSLQLQLVRVCGFLESQRLRWHGRAYISERHRTLVGHCSRALDAAADRATLASPRTPKP